jgi:hypothetical protein
MAPQIAGSANEFMILCGLLGMKLEMLYLSLKYTSTTRTFTLLIDQPLQPAKRAALLSFKGMQLKMMGKFGRKNPVSGFNQWSTNKYCAGTLL